MTVPSPLRYVPKSILRETFNTLRLYERCLAGEVRHSVLRERHLRPGSHNFPPCTHTQIDAYFDPAGQPIAKVHQYRLPDGALGASGRPDPLWVFDGHERLAAVETSS
jgi:hypothetical protein